jgi:acyl-coenzyme A thioesterase PaaI-like protein
MNETTDGITLDVLKELVENKVAFVSRMHLKVMDLRPRYVKLWAPLRGNENHVGSMYAGALFTLAEIPGGALCLATFDATRYYPLVKEMTIRFVRPARTDVTIECSLSTGEADRIKAAAELRGKADFALVGHITDQGGEVVAISKGIYQIREIDALNPRRRGQPLEQSDIPPAPQSKR